MSDITFADFAEQLRERTRGECSSLLKGYPLSEFYPLLSGGRFLRSRMAFEIATSRGESLLAACTALEMLHVSTLIHDDVIDEALTRRGEPTISSARGDGVAVLVGNLLAVRAIEIGQTLGEVSLPLLETSRRVNYAQMDELFRRGRVDKTLDEYLAIGRGKTASMFQFAAHVGLEHSGPPTDGSGNDLDSFMLALESFGLAFQLSDDIEDVEEYLTRAEVHPSKKGMSDIEMGNFTAPVILASEVGSSQSDIRKIDIDQISMDDWQVGLDQAAEMRDHYVAVCLDTLRSLALADGPTAAARLLPWLARVTDKLQSGSVDQSVVTA